MRDPWVEEKIATTKKFGLSTLAGVAVIASAFAQKEDLSKFALIFLGAMLIVPFFIHETVFTVWH